MSRKLFIGILLSALILTFSSIPCLSAEKVTLMLDWYPNTNHSGIYAAKELGFYKKANISVKIVQPSRLSVEQLVGIGKADFGISFQDMASMAMGKGIPIISIAAIIQHNTSGYGFLKTSNISTPKDFEGKKYGTWGTDIEKATLRYVMRKFGGDISKVKFVNVGMLDFATGLKKGVFDFQWIFYGWEGIAAKLKGLKIGYIPLAKLDPIFDYYTPIIITSRKLAKNKPNLVRKFMQATAKGYEFAIAHPKKVAKILLKYSPELDKKVVYASQAWLSPRYKADAPYWGYQKKEVWERYTTWLFKEGFLKKKISLEEAFTNEFVKP